MQLVIAARGILDAERALQVADRCTLRPEGPVLVVGTHAESVDEFGVVIRFSQVGLQTEEPEPAEVPMQPGLLW